MYKYILVVDDSESLREVVKICLEGAGYQVTQAGNGEEAMAVIDTEEFDLIICDVNMPVMNGIEFLKAVKAHPEFKFIPFVMLTTEDQTELIETGKQLGAKAWAVKPFNPEQMVSIVSQLVGEA